MITSIAAVDRNFVIGANDGMVWSYPEDQKRFKELTMGATLIMGSKTWASISGPLSGRTKIIVSSQSAKTLNEDRKTQPQNFYIAGTIDRAIKLASDLQSLKTFVIGGASIYQQTMDLVDCIDLTLVPEIVFEPITNPINIKYFPQIPKEFTLISEEVNANDARLTHRLYSRTV